jgi:hypothetical protein
MIRPRSCRRCRSCRSSPWKLRRRVSLAERNDETPALRSAALTKGCSIRTGRRSCCRWPRAAAFDGAGVETWKLERRVSLRVSASLAGEGDGAAQESRRHGRQRQWRSLSPVLCGTACAGWKPAVQSTASWKLRHRVSLLEPLLRGLRSGRGFDGLEARRYAGNGNGVGFGNPTYDGGGITPA